MPRAALDDGRRISWGEYGDAAGEPLVLLLPAVTLAGASGGGAFAVAAALAHPERVKRLLLVSAAVPAPRGARRGTSGAVRLLLILSRYAPGLAGTLLARQVSGDLDAPLARWARRRMPAGDRRLFDEPQWRAGFQLDFAEGLRQGPAAAVHDLALTQLGAAGADVADLTVETVLLHGTENANVPIGLARWIAARVPAALLIELPGAGGTCRPWNNPS